MLKSLQRLLQGLSKSTYLIYFTRFHLQFFNYLISFTKFNLGHFFFFLIAQYYFAIFKYSVMILIKYNVRSDHWIKNFPAISKLINASTTNHLQSTPLKRLRWPVLWTDINITITVPLLSLITALVNWGIVDRFHLLAPDDV